MGNIHNFRFMLKNRAQSWDKRVINVGLSAGWFGGCVIPMISEIIFWLSLIQI